MNSTKKTANQTTQKPIYVAIAAAVVAILVAIPFLGTQSSTSEPIATLPLGLLLESTSGRLTVVQAMKDATSFGIMQGDVISSVDDTSVNSVASFRKALETKQSGDTLNLVVQRGDQLLTINRRYRGRLEVPSEIGTVYSPSLVRTSSETSISKSTDDSDGSGHVMEETKVISSEWADFGLRFNEENGRLIVTSVKPASASAAYGVEPGDILFQLDNRKITSLSDFQRVAADKFVTDRASMMIIRGENIVLLRDMVLGGSSTEVNRPEGYEPAIYPFASLEKDALERLLTNPFGQEMSIPSSAHFPPAPDEDAIADDSAPQEIESAAEQEFPGVDLPYADEPFVLDPAEIGEPNYAQTSPDSPEFAELPDRRRPSNSRVRRFSEVEGITSVANASPNFPKPNATPRFNKYSGIRLPDIAPEPADGRDLGVADSLVDTVEQNNLDDASTAFYDGVRTEASGSFDAGAASQAEVPLSANSTSQPLVPLSPSESGASDLAAQVAPANPTSPVEVSDLFVGDKVFDASKSQVAQPVYEPSRFEDSRTLETAVTPVVESQPPVHNVAQDLNTGLEATSTNGTWETNVASQEAASEPGGQGQPCELGQTPALPAQPACVACGDWGCDQCIWKSRNEEFSINRMLYGDCTPTVSIGGWLSAGYHSASNDLFNSREDEIALHQGWLFAEKRATNDSPIGFRADLMYGIDADDTQAFGNDIGNWDFQNGFDHGPYGWAIPQLYLELSLGQWNIKAGHFFTTVGYEVVTAPDNFFYSHAMTMYNSEPFTHTGIIASRMIGEKIEIYAGWTLGWDTGFDQFNDGSSWLGGVSYAPMEDVTVTYMSTAGNFGARGTDGYSHSVVANLVLTNQLTWVVQSDYVRVGGTGEDNVGLNQYLLYEVNEQLGVGTRLEWWKGDVLTGYAPHGGMLPANGTLSYYAATFGVNYQPRGNVILRPEVRYDWSPAANYDKAYFGMDAILKF